MNVRFSLCLIVGGLCLLTARAQVTPNDQDPYLTPVVTGSSSSEGTTAAWWDHVTSLKQKGVTGTSGLLTHYSKLTSGKFAGKQPGEEVVIGDGKKHAFYDLDLRDLPILIQGGSEVAFYNCRFGQSPGMSLKNDAPLMATGEGTRLILRFCDFEGPGDGSGSGAMLRGPVEKNGQAAFIDAAYCRTWGQASDGWKIGHSISRFCYFDPSVATKKMPETWDQNKTYQPGDYVTNGSLYTSHVWKAWRETNEQPSFDIIAGEAKKKGIVNKEMTNGWVYINPHADVFHIYGGRYQVRAEGLFLNSKVGQMADSVKGVAMIGINNSVRRDNGDEKYRPQGGGTVRGCLILRDNEQQSKALHSVLGASQDSGFLKFQHLRISGSAKSAVHGGSIAIFEGLQDIEGKPLVLPEHLEEKLARVSDAYFARGNPRSKAPTLVVANTWQVKPTGFAPAKDQDGNPINAVVYFADGKRIAYVADNGTTYVAPGYEIKKLSGGQYEIKSKDQSSFKPVIWRGGADSPTSPDEKSNPAANLQITEFSRDKAPFDSGFGRDEKNEARIPFSVEAKNGGKLTSDVTIEARIITENGEDVATWTEPGQEKSQSKGWQVLGKTDNRGKLVANLYTARHPEYLRREVRVKGHSDTEVQTDNSFGVGHTIIIFAQSNLDQGFNEPSSPVIPIPKVFKRDMVQHYYHRRFNGDQKKVGEAFIRHWSTGIQEGKDKDDDKTGWPTAFANVLSKTRPNDKFFVVWHVHQGTDYIDMVVDGGKRIPQAEEALARYVYADGQDRGGIAGGAWTHTPGITGESFEEAHFPIFFKKKKDGTPVKVGDTIRYGKGNKKYTLGHWIGEWYDLDHITYALQDPHQFGPRGYLLTSATDAIDPNETREDKKEKDRWFIQREGIRKSIREMIGNPNATDTQGESIMLPIFMGALNYSIGEINGSGTGYGDVTHPSADTPDGGMLFNALIAHGFLRAAGLTDWPEPVFDRHYRHPKGEWWEWWSTAGPITTTRRERGEPRPTPPQGYNASHWTEVVAFQINKKPAQRVEIVNGRVRIYPPTGKTFALDDLDDISHGDGGASGHLNDQQDRIAELWKDIAIIDFGLPGVDGVALRAQIPPTTAGDATNNEYVNDRPSTDPGPDTTRPYVTSVVGTPTAVTVTYSEPIRPRDFGRVFINTVPANQRAVDIEVTQKGTTPGTIEYNGATLTVRPASPLPAGEYAWRPQDDVLEDLAGNFAKEVRNNYYHPFTIDPANARTSAQDKTAEAMESWGSGHLYPNPNQGQFTVRIPEADHQVMVRILSLSGQVLREQSASGKGRIAITTTLPPGVYMLHVVGPQSSYVSRLVIE